MGIFVVLSQVLFVEAQTDIRKDLAQTAAATGTVYISGRNALVGFGSNAIPQLTTISMDPHETWQVRLMAGIVAERIQRANDIDALVQKNWRDDPEYDKGWDLYHGGPGRGLSSLVLKRYKELTLWWYFVEQVWKETGEHSKKPRMAEDSWRGIARTACKGSPVYNLIIPVVAERIQNDIGFKKYERWGEFKFLMECGTNTILPQVLEIIEKAPLNNRNQAWRTVASDIAQPEDTPMIDKHFKDKGQEIPEALVEPLKDLKERLKKKSETK
jgi:hypothetical protein